MTDFANLVLGVDSREVTEGTKALDGFVGAGKRAEGAASGFAKASHQVTVSAGQQRAGMQQLSFQIGDVAQQFALGTNPMIIFAQQGQQVVQALNMMRGGAGGLIGFLGGPWGAVIMGATMILAPFIAKLFDSGTAADTAAEAYRGAADEARGLIGAMNALALNQKRMDLNKLVEERIALENRVAKSPYANDPNAGWFSQNSGVGGAKRRLQEIAWAEVEARNLIGIAEAGNRAAEASARVSTASGGAARGIRGTGTAARAAKTDIEDYAKALANMQSDYWDKTMSDFKKSLASDDPSRIMVEIANQRAAAADFERQRVEALNKSYSDLFNQLQGQGGIGRALSSALAIGTGNYDKVGGNFGITLRSIMGTEVQATGADGKEFTSTLGKEFTKSLDQFFGGNGRFTNAISNASTGMAFGSFVGSTVFGNSKSAKTGAMIGALTGYTPLGMLAGALIGGLIGSAFKKTKKGSATLGQGEFGIDVVGTAGNSTSRKSAASSIANDLGGAIESIANAFGSSATGSFATSIGIRNKKYVVDPTGQGRTKGPGVLNFGKDEEAAIKAAILDAIKDGAIVGMSEAVKRLLTNGGDLERQLAKAQKWQGAMDEIAQMADPVAFALKKVTLQFEELNRIAGEAGASTAELADLEKLLGIKREEAARSALDSIRDSYTLETKILQMLGKDEQAVAAGRVMELAALKSTLQPLQAMVYELEDARGVIDTFQPLADDLKAYRDELLGGGSNASFGQLTAQFRATAALASTGDATALGKLRGVSSDYLDAAMKNAGSLADYNRARGSVLAAVDSGIFAAETKVDYAQAQIDAINNSANIIERMRSELVQLQTQLVMSNASVERIWKRIAPDDAMNVQTVTDTTLTVELTA